MQENLNFLDFYLRYIHSNQYLKKLFHKILLFYAFLADFIPLSMSRDKLYFIEKCKFRGEIEERISVLANRIFFNRCTFYKL